MGDSLQLLDSHRYGCSDEILTIAAMTSVQVRLPSPHLFQHNQLTEPSKIVQNVFVLDDGGDTIRGELERRKFTTEEGDHLTALNAYNAFVKCMSSLFFFFVSMGRGEQAELTSS